ncbi:MAG TPA: hypothetical protein PJ994_11380, partial [Tepidiformaceae bacterium]|nr:hypothetical protein [Tepidiformaceae bacterium]
MSKLKENDRVRIVSRPVTEQDRKANRYYEHMAGQTGTVAAVYGPEEVAVRVDLDQMNDGGRILGQQHLGHAVQRRGLGRSGARIGACNQNRHRTQRFHRGQGLGHLVGRQLPVIHIGKKKNGHLTALPLRLS